MFRFSHWHLPAGEISAPIQPNPLLKALRQIRIILLIGVVILLVVMALFQISMLYLNGLYPRVPQDFAATYFLLFLGSPFLLVMSISLLSNLRQVRYWQRIEALRFAALAEDRQLLADEQPSPDAKAITLPVTITMRSTARSALTNLLVLLAIMGGYLFYSLFILQQTWLSSLPYLGLASVLIVAFIFWRVRSTLLVTPEGVRIPASGGYSWVSWDEMRLFACYRSQESLKNGTVLTYEISTAGAIIRWTWLQRPATFWSTQVPTLPFSEHTDQMKTFAQYIVAKTGLPLYDLSKGQIGEFAPTERYQTTIVSPQRQPAQAHGPSTMICSNPLLGTLKMARLMYLGIAALLVVEILFMHATFYLSELTSQSSLSGFFTSLWSVSAMSALNLLLWLGLGLLISLIERYWKRIERLRFSAAAGIEHLRALNLPQPGAEALQLPTTITLRMARLFALFVGLAFFVGMILFLLLMDVVNPAGGTFFLSWPVNMVALILLAGLACGIYLLYSRRRRRIEVSEDGIRMYESKKVVTHVPWREARLFVCYNAPVARRSGDELICELSSGSSVVRWSWVQRAGSPWLMWTTITPFAEHRANMQALAELVTTRTGLPLYDLRGEQ
ncbi:MAG: hypothetical protein H0U76_01660 [Ktedonobacteraceae bacterium]|nr:hypothetical protein [Ktedonobacteraceae bacterium]